MGYYTDFYFEVMGVDEPMQQYFIKKFNDFLNTKWKYRYETFTTSGRTYDQIKWYDSWKDLHEFAEKNPGYTFVLKGFGEDTEDIWIAWARDQWLQKEKGKVVYPDPNPVFLDPPAENIYAINLYGEDVIIEE